MSFEGAALVKGYKMLHERDGVKASGPEPPTKANALADSQLRFVGALRVTKPHRLSNSSSHSLLPWRRTRRAASS